VNYHDPYIVLYWCNRWNQVFVVYHKADLHRFSI